MARHKSEEKQDAIMQATLHLVIEEGFHGLSMSKIAKKAGIATATIYVYFENTGEIINLLYLNLKELISADIMKGYNDTMTTEKGFKVIWRNYFDSIRKYAREFQYLEQFANSPYITQVSKEEGRKQFKPFLDFFDQAMAHGNIKKMSQGLVLALFIAPMSSLAKNINSGQSQIDETAIELAMNSTWLAMKK